jgi:hypothetical protein
LPKETPKSGGPAKPVTPPRGKRRQFFQFVLPDDDQIETWRQELPSFKPIDTKQLLADARARSDGETTVDAEKLLAEHLRAQMTTLLEALGVDLNKPTVWSDAFRKLAMIHHGVGRMGHRKLPRRQQGPRNIADDDFVLLVAVTRWQHGCSDRDAVRQLADDDQIPYHERPEHRGARHRRGHKGPRRSDDLSMREEARERKFSTLWRQYMRAKKRKGPGAVLPALADAFGSSGNAFETMLQMLEAGARLKPPP